MDAQQLDAILRVSGVTLLVVLALILAGDRRRRRAAAFFAPLAVCLSGFLAGNTPDAGLRLTGAWGGVAHLLSGYAAVFLWWFCLAIFDRRFKPQGPVLAAGLAWIVIASADRGLFGPRIAGAGLSWVLIAIGFGMMGHLAWRLIRDREGDLVERRREARVLVAVLLAGQLLLDMSVDVIFGLGWRPSAFTIMQNAAILAFSAWVLSLLLRADGGLPAPAGGVSDDRARGASDLESAYADGEVRLARRLQALIEVERVHLDPGLTFNALAEKTGSPDPAVRHFINHRLGHDHFRAFLNTHRMAEARRLLADPARTRDKLISIALDSGFASLASFNRVFRAAQGCTPSEYRDALRRTPGGQGADPLAMGPQPTFEERSVAF